MTVKTALCRVWLLAVFLPGVVHAAVVPLVTGNGHGFAVVRPADGVLTSLWTHPYAFEAPDPENALSEGRPTTNFLAGLRWDDGGAPAKAAVGYVRQSHLIKVDDGHGATWAYMPFGLARPALVVARDAARSPRAQGRWQVQWTHAVAGREPVRGRRCNAQLLSFEGVRDRLLLVPLDVAGAVESSKPAGEPTSEPAGERDDLAGHRGWVFMPLEPAADAVVACEDLAHWRGGLDARALAQRELRQLERWRTPVPRAVAGQRERNLWRQSEVVLRMAQSREPNTATRRGHGLIVASLPDGSWATPWVRDMAYAIVALARMGHHDEARAGLLAWFNAAPTGLMRSGLADADYQVSVVRYFGDGTEEPFFTQEGATNIELDNWGLALWALGEVVARAPRDGLPDETTRRGTVYEASRDLIVRPLLRNLEAHGDGAIVRADTSIWEERQVDEKHFAYTTAAAIAGLRAFLPLAKDQADHATVDEVAGALATLERGFQRAFVRDGQLHGTLEAGPKNDVDGALLAIAGLGVIDQPELLDDLVARMERLKVASGGYRRVHSVLADPAVFEYWYERQEFVFVDLELARVLARLGRGREARLALDRIVRIADGENGLVPEMLVAEPCTLFPGRVGDATGAMPMVGYGAGALVVALLAQR